MKVLHILGSKSWGGGTVSLVNLFDEMFKSAPEVTNILFCMKNSQIKDKLENFRYKYIEAPAAINLDPRFILKLIKTCKKENIDLIHLHGPNALTAAVIADKFSDLPPMVFSKKTSFPIKQRKQTLYKYNYPKIKRIICVSEKALEVTESSIENKKRLSVIHNGIFLDKMSAETPFLLREKYGIDPKKKIIGNIGNHIKAKDLDTFINIADYLINIKKKKDLHFVQIGSFQELTPQLQEKVNRLNLEEHLSFTGFIASASNFIPQFQVFLLTSKSEGGHRVVYEAIYHKVPVVSTKVGSVPEIIENGINGFFAPSGDFKVLSEYIEELLENPDLGERFTAISLKKLVPAFTTTSTAKKMLEEYRERLKSQVA